MKPLSNRGLWNVWTAREEIESVDHFYNVYTESGYIAARWEKACDGQELPSVFYVRSIEGDRLLKVYTSRGSFQKEEEVFPSPSLLNLCLLCKRLQIMQELSE